MSLITILAAGALLSIAWRVLHFVIRIALLIALIALITHYAGQHANHGRTPTPPTATQPTR